MLNARFRGGYLEPTWVRLALLGGAVGYLVSPVDLLPELVLAIPGLLDDTVIAAWVAGALLDETERFIEWERRTDRQVIEGSTVSYPGRARRP